MKKNSLLQSITADDFLVYEHGYHILTKLKKSGLLTHSNGLFILAPSGAGKSYFISHQAKNNWIDGDDLWPICGADYSNTEWNKDIEDVMEINARCDIITLQAKKSGLWVIGSSNLFLRPDAIVLPPWQTHCKYISSREKVLYGDGATSNDLDGVKQHRKWIRQWMKYGVPCFDDIAKATSYCEKITETSNEVLSRS